MSHDASVLFNRLLARGKFRHVQILLKVAELGSLQRAADSIGMTQSSVTQGLAYLERLLEVQLFERHARGVRPTQACEDLLPVARRMLIGVADGAEVVAARRQRIGGAIRLVASVGAMNGLLLDVLPRFAQRHPDVTVHLSEAEGDDQLLAIARGEADLVACRRPPVIPEGWHFIPVREDRFAVLARADHPLVRKRSLGWPQLADETWLLAPTGSAARERFDELTANLPHPIRTYPVVTRSTAMLWWLSQQENLLSFLPLNFVRPLLDAGLLRELKLRPLYMLEPLGLMCPIAGPFGAWRQLVDFMNPEVPH
ncbi:LysR family transcriptional regulator (plasmid) [Variovorax sp. V213]|uniref:LysR family transcriptional regulator n=1 Tax=Variovorax sp. V213 TaxID=3065955 RepID=UPI0034E8628D